MNDKLHFVHDRFAVSCARLEQPIVRACFSLERVPSKQDALFGIASTNNVVHYGQHVRIRLCGEMSNFTNSNQV